MQTVDLTKTKFHLRRNLCPRAVTHITEIQDTPCLSVLHLLYRFVDFGEQIDKPINLSVNLFFTFDDFAMVSESCDVFLVALLGIPVITAVVFSAILRRTETSSNILWISLSMFHA